MSSESHRGFAKLPKNTADPLDRPVHCTRFSPSKTEILSASDDGTVRLWDLPSQTPIHTFAGHSDYVRTCAFLPSNPSLVLSGSYDGTVKLWDARVGGGESGDSQLTMGRPGAGAMPVEALLAFPDGSAGGSGGLCLSAGGPILRLWDLAMAGRCVRALSNHQKTITCMSFDSNRRRVLTGGLDQLVKVYDVEDWSVVHTMRYPAPLLSLAMSPDDTHIAAGMTDGTLSVRRRDPKASEVAAEETERAALSTGAYEYFADFEQVFGRGHVKTKGAKVEVPVAPIEESRVETLRRKKLKDYDKYLKKFRYGQALDAVTAKKVRAGSSLGYESTKLILVLSLSAPHADCPPRHGIRTDPRTHLPRRPADSTRRTRRRDLAASAGFLVSARLRPKIRKHGG